VADPASQLPILDPDAWSDAPQAVIDRLRASLGTDLVIDAAGAGPVPAQVAQLLLAARASALAGGHAFRLDPVSDAARQSLEAIGLGLLLEAAP
jgi:hypothetical protein